MLKDTIRFHLFPAQFTEKESQLAEYGEFIASGFRYPSGVCALRLKNNLGELVLLPFQGQQIWDANMLGRRLTMKSMFNQPYPTRDFLSTYGAFLLHCGATAMGVPGPQDQHPLHGDLPNAPYSEAWLELGQDENGAFIGLGGYYTHTLAFNYHYRAEPLVKIYAGSSVFHVSMTITNLKQSKMPLMYLAHVNFRPVDNGRLVSTVEATPEHMRVRADFPDFMEVDPAFRQFVQELKTNPQKHTQLKTEMKYDPELVFFMDYYADSQGWAHSLQIHPDGSADVVRHRTTQLNHTLRWICRTPDQDAIGFEPATAEGTGYSSEKDKGNLRWLAPEERFHCDLQIGVLTSEEAALQEQRLHTLAYEISRHD
ncbi:MAG: DUF4432 domain-containing protein [Chloroflexi bacterium HGW-Chloroflexi-10]|nr:MAG: DUF4432 domain-containing protein [Chloroflexi bacterium HGW-Chloroflexi-10]